MGLFGLGSFGQGFVGGLAESANKALKEDMEAIKDRVKKVSDYRVQRAIDEQEERKDELEQIEDALKEGASLFGDDPRAADYAASMLQEQGSISAYNTFIAGLRQKKNETGIELGQFFRRAEVDAPVGKGFTVSDYAKAYQGAPKTLPDYRLPEGAATAGAGRLLSAIGLDQDVTGQIQTATEQTAAAMGLDKQPDVPSRTILPKIKFMADEYNTFDMTASERIKYFNEKLVNPALSDKKRAEYQGKLDKQLSIAAQSNDEQVRLSALQQQYDTAPADKKPAIQEEIVKLNSLIKRKEAELNLDEDPLGVVKLDMNAAYRRSIDPALSEDERSIAEAEFRTLQKQVSDFSKEEPTVVEDYQERLNKFQRRVNDDPTFKGSAEYNEEVAALEDMKASLVDPNAKFTDTEYTTVNRMIDDQIETLATINLSVDDKKRYETIVTALATGPVDLTATQRKLYERVQAEMRRVKGDAILAVRNTISNMDVSVVPTMTQALDSIAYTQGVTTPGTAAMAPSSAEASAQAKAVIPDSAEGASSLVDRLDSTKPVEEQIKDIDDTIQSSNEMDYVDPEFNKILTDKKNELESKLAAEKTGAERFLQEEAASVDIPQKPTLEQAIEATEGKFGASTQRRAIMDALGVSKEEAAELQKQIKEERAKRRKETKGRRRIDTRAMSTRGLMSRGE